LSGDLAALSGWALEEWPPSPGAIRIRRSDFVAEAADGVVELAEAEFEAGLDGAEGGIGVNGDFALAHAFEEGEIDGLTLKGGEGLDALAEELAEIVVDDVVIDAIVNPGVGLVLGFEFETLGNAVIGLAFAEPVDGPAAGEGDDPAEGLAFFLGVVFCLAPDLHEDLLEQVVGLGLVVDDANDEGFEDAAIAVVEGGKGLRVAVGDGAHEGGVFGGGGGRRTRQYKGFHEVHGMALG